jgi:hypothetical protein
LITVFIVFVVFGCCSVLVLFERCKVVGLF